MAGGVSVQYDKKESKTSRTTSEPKWVKYSLIALSVGFVGLFLILPLISIFFGAFSSGLGDYLQAISSKEALLSILLTLVVVALTLPLNLVFGIVGAWALTKFSFRGKSILLTLLDLPFAVSPVIVGFMFVLMYGKYGVFSSAIAWLNIDVIFSFPGIVIVTHFVTLPLIIRELIPLMNVLGNEEEEAAVALGASGWQTFLRVTLPNIRWALLYGATLSIARGIGEFGAVSVVSGHIEGKTNTMPLFIEILYNEYAFTDAFAISSLMSIFGIFALVLKKFVEKKYASSTKGVEQDEH
ncbi:MAG: sulfate ABC transporter permease subunit CysW [Bacilli bacterium]